MSVKNYHNRIKTILIALLFMGMGAEPLLAQVAIYQTNFNKTNEWKGAEPAKIAPFGRSGSCLKISTYDKNGDLAKWTSPMLKIKPGTYTVSSWMADNLAYTQDSGYGGMLAAVLYDGGGKEIKRIELAKVYKRPYRGNSDHYHIPSKDGLEWRYSEHGLEIPGNVTAYQLVFTWSEFTVDWRRTKGNIFGEVYLDDIVVRSGNPQKDLSASVAKAAPLPYQLRINTPVYANTFLKQDPLEFTVRLDGKDGPPPVKRGMMLKYRIEDFQHLLLDAGEIPLAQPYYYWRKSPKAKQESLVKTFYLGDKIKKEVGKWMAIKIELFDGNTKIAEGENAFLITDPRILTKKQAEISHFWGGALNPQPNKQQGSNPWGQDTSVRYNQLQKKGAFGLQHRGYDCRWPERQPTKKSSIDFSKEPEQYSHSQASRRTFTFQERDPLYYYTMFYTQIRKHVPDWALATGKTRSDDDFIDPEAYAKYVEAYVRHTDGRIYMTIGLEGADITHFPKLAKAAYAAVKRVDRRIKVMCQVDYLKGREYAKILCDSGLIDYVDVLAFDVYSVKLGSSINDFRQYLEERGKLKEYLVPEYSYTGSYDQEERSRRIPDFCLGALANGVDKLRWYSNWNPTVNVRAPIEGGWGQTGILTGQDEKLSPGATILPSVAYNRNYARGNLYPFLQEAMLYNMYENFSIEKFRTFLDLGKDTEGVLFDGDGYSSACIWRHSGQARINVIVDSGGVPFTIIDIYGRRNYLCPTGDKTLITIGQNPLIFRFDRLVTSFTAVKADFSVTKSQSAVAPGESVDVTVGFTNPFGRSWAGELCLEVGSGWRVAPLRNSVALAPGKSIKTKFTLTAPENITAGNYPLIISLDNAIGKTGVVYDEITVGAPVALTLSERPFTHTSRAALIATLRNDTAKNVSGVVKIQGDLGDGAHPPLLEREVVVEAGKTTVVKFDLGKWKPNMNRDYPVHAAFYMADGAAIKAKRTVSFRGVPRRKAPIKIDGKLDDWDFDKLVTFDFFMPREPSNLVGINKDGNPKHMQWKGVEDASGTFNIQWDDERIYFAFQFKDDTFLPGRKGRDLSFWSWDTLGMALYPHGVQPEDTIMGSPYFEHIGLDGEGQSCYERIAGPVGNWFIGAGSPEGTEVAVSSTPEGVIMEFSVPIKQFAPLTPLPGARFAISLMYCDRDNKGENGSKPGIAWYYASTNVDMNPKHFGNFVLVDGKQEK